MARSLSTGALAQLLSDHIRLVFFVQAQFLSGTIFVWNGLGSVSWNGQTWVGVGNLLNISTVSEATDIAARNMTLTLSSIPQDMLTRALNECRQNFPVSVFLGFLASDGSIVADPYQSFSGHMDVPTLAEGTNDATISLSCENPLIDMDRSPNRRFTNDDQKQDFPTDQGFLFVSAIQSWNGTWGKAGPGAGLPGVVVQGTGSSTGSSTNGNTTCFTENVLVLTPGGPRRISDIQVGEMVFTLAGARPVAQTFVHPNGPVLHMWRGEGITPNHLVYRHAEGDWVPASQLFAMHLQYSGQLYDLQIATDIDEERNFCLANGKVVHNKIKTT